MIENSRKARREADKRNRLYYLRNFRRFLALAHNAVKFNEALGDTPKRYIMKVLLDNGAIAYDKQTKLYLRFVPIGYDVYGLPTAYTLYGYNGLTLTRTPQEVVILRINDIQEPVVPFLQMQAEKVTKFDNAIEQNLEAIRTMTVYECSDDSQALTMVNEAEQRRIGATVVFRRKSSFNGIESKVSSTGAQYLIDKLMEAKQKIINETLTELGIATANTDKRERVQGIEVNTSLSYAHDSIYLMTDTFNYDAEQGGLDIRLKPNTSLIDLWENIKNEKTLEKDKGIPTEDKN